MFPVARIVSTWCPRAKNSSNSGIWRSMPQWFCPPAAVHTNVSLSWDTAVHVSSEKLHCSWSGAGVGHTCKHSPLSTGQAVHLVSYAYTLICNYTLYMHYSQLNIIVHILHTHAHTSACTHIPITAKYAYSLSHFLIERMPRNQHREGFSFLFVCRITYEIQLLWIT